jgi:hypothetical protein
VEDGHHAEAVDIMVGPSRRLLASVDIMVGLGRRVWKTGTTRSVVGESHHCHCSEEMNQVDAASRRIAASDRMPLLRLNAVISFLPNALKRIPWQATRRADPQRDPVGRHTDTIARRHRHLIAIHDYFPAQPVLGPRVHAG